MQVTNWNRTGRTLPFTRLGFGTAPLGNLYRAISDTEARKVLEAAWDGGVRFFDTAPLYGLGLSETRLNSFLRGKPRDSYLISTKVGRLLRAATPDTRDGIGKWFDVPARKEVYDYGYDAVLRSVEFSLERLGIDRIDILFAHDLDLANHGTPDALQARLDEFMSGGYHALVQLRDEGVISAFGAGVNAWEPCQWMMDRGDFDLFLLAGRYTLLEQGALGFMDEAARRGVGVVIGGPFNSGILATGPRPGAYFNYEPAPPAIMEHAASLQSACAAHGVALAEAALHFPLLHPAAICTIPGGQGLTEMTANLAAIRQELPAALWTDLKARGLIEPGAPTG